MFSQDVSISVDAICKLIQADCEHILLGQPTVQDTRKHSIQNQIETSSLSLPSSVIVIQHQQSVHQRRGIIYKATKCQTVNFDKENLEKKSFTKGIQRKYVALSKSTALSDQSFASNHSLRENQQTSEPYTGLCFTSEKKKPTKNQWTVKKQPLASIDLQNEQQPSAMARENSNEAMSLKPPKGIGIRKNFSQQFLSEQISASQSLLE